MESAFLLIFLIVFVAMVIAAKMAYRIVFGVFVLLCLMFNEYGAGMDRCYGRGAVIQSVRILAQISPEEQRKELVKASEKFSKEYRKERYGMTASFQLLEDVEEVEKSVLTGKQQVQDVPPE